MQYGGQLNPLNRLATIRRSAETATGYRCAGVDPRMKIEIEVTARHRSGATYRATSTLPPYWLFTRSKTTVSVLASVRIS